MEDPKPETPADAAPAAPRPGARPFRRTDRTARLAPDEQVRQGRAVKAAQAALGDVASVRAFLNTHHPALDARPLDLATASDAGLVAVEAALQAESGPKK